MPETSGETTVAVPRACGWRCGRGGSATSEGYDTSTGLCSMASCAAVSCLCNVHRNQQPREPVKGTGIHFGDLLDAIEAKINCVGVDLEKARVSLTLRLHCANARTV